MTVFECAATVRLRVEQAIKTVSMCVCTRMYCFLKLFVESLQPCMSAAVTLGL